MKIEVELPVYPAHSRFVVEQEIAGERFACDLGACKGACCTMPGGQGAPLLPQEVPIMDEIYGVVEQYLPQSARTAIAKKGTWQREPNGEFTVQTVDGNECVFVHWDGQIAHCAIQTAYRKGELEGFEKPISCHLYPIRIDAQPEKDSYLIRYDILSDCDPARERGDREEIPLMDFLATPLVRALGKERTKILTDHLKAHAKH